MPHPPKSLPPSWGEGVAAYAATDEGASLPRPVSMGRAGLGPVPAQRRGPLMGTAGAQRPKGTRRGGFQPPEKPSTSWGEGVAAYAATDEGASLPRPASMGRAGLGPVPAQRRGPLMGTAGAQRPKGTRRGGFQPSEKHSPGGKVSRRMPRRMRGRSSARLWPQGGTPKNTSSPPSGRAGGSRGGELWNQ